jgi:mevalonate kinase
MSAEKRPASEDPSGGQLVKRQNIGTSRALATRSNGAGGGGALIQVVRSEDQTRLVIGLKGLISL